MKIWKVVLAVMVIFGAGVVTGGLLVRVRVPARPPASASVLSGPGGLLGAGRQQFVQRLNRQLDLNPQQSAEVELIMRESHLRMTKIWDPVAPHAREETRQVRQQIQAILTPQQKSKYNEIFKPKRPRDASRKDRTDFEGASNSLPAARIR